MKFTTQIAFVMLIAFYSCEEKKINYPETRKSDQEDSYFGTVVKDPYRWLEDDQSEETGAWVKSQNELTFAWLEKIPFRKKVQSRIEDLWNYERHGLPFRKAGKYYFDRNDGLQNQSVYYVQDSLNGEPRVFIDPNKFSADGTIALGGLAFSKDGSYYAYSVSEAGSDWEKIIVMQTDSGTPVGDSLKNVKFSDISWYENEGIFYSSYDKPSEGSVLSGMTIHHKLYYHKIGTSQADDQLVFGGDQTPRRYIGAKVSEDHRYLVITAAESTSGNELYFKDLKQKNGPVLPIATGFGNNYLYAGNNGSNLLIMTDFKAPNYRLIAVDALHPDQSHWAEIVPEKEEVLTGVTTAGNRIFLEYLKDASTRIYQCDINGKTEYEVKLPDIGTAKGFIGDKEDSSVFFQFTSFIHPTTIYHYHISSGKYEVFKSPKVKFDPAQYETRQVFFESKDGTKIPMFIVNKKILKMDGKNPLLLYGYGGFNISLTPTFSVRWLAWLDMGGVFALPNLRGGGEYGENWHQAGMKFKKQNVFDDFISAAEYLHTQGYSSPEYTALFGGSNGGLLVGAVMTQRPDLCRVALPAVGVMDMLRYHQFTAGAGWISDYGCADSSQAMFEYIYAYSPVHNVKENTKYPATLVTTADHDDRVVPAHSFKFAAELQARQAGANPVLIRIEARAGHGAGKPTSKVIEELADQYSFAFYNMKLQPAYDE